MPKMQRDKKFLKALAQASHSLLRERHLGKPFRVSDKVRIRDTETEGWAATIGSYGPFQTSAEVWLDRFTGHPTRKVYYALYSSKPDGLAKLAQAARPEFGPHLAIYPRHWDDDAKHIRLEKQLAKARFGHPLYERYKANKEYFFGIYEFDRTGLRRNELTRLVERVADFFQTISDSISRDERERDYDTYRTVENRKSVARHLKRERRRRAATLRKQLDNYICQICGFDFSESYPVLGIDFAEAHHIIPLHRNDSARSTTVKDLLTVCANCHRMLHRLSGRKADIAHLRKIQRVNK